MSPAPVTATPCKARIKMNDAEESTSGNRAYTPAPSPSTTSRTLRLSNRSPAHANGTTAAVCASVNPVVYIPMMSPALIDRPKTVVPCGSSVLM